MLSCPPRSSFTALQRSAFARGLPLSLMADSPSTVSGRTTPPSESENVNISRCPPASGRKRNVPHSCGAMVFSAPRDGVPLPKRSSVFPYGFQIG